MATLVRGGTLLLPDAEGGVRAVAGDLLIEGDRIGRVDEGGSDRRGPAPPATPPPAAPAPGTPEASAATALEAVSGAASENRTGTRAGSAPGITIDAAGCAVLPGFVQTHVHLCQALFRGVADDLSLLDWLRTRIWPLEAAHTPDSIRASARLSIAELLRGGTTAVQTMETVHHTDAVLEAVAECGMPAVVGKCLMDDPRGVPDGLRQTTDEALQEAVDLAERWHGRGRLRVCLAPRFAVSCTTECLRQVAGLAETNGWRIHTHASENRDEVALIAERTGRRNVTYLDELGCTGSHVGMAHCVWVEEPEIELLARSGTHVLHCPTSNCKLASGLAPVPRMLDAGVSVSLGADGAPCNNNLDMFHEMRLAAVLHKPSAGARAMPASRVLWMATAGGAAALGQEGEIGVLAEGAWADVIVVDLRRLHSVPARDPVSALVYSARADDIRHVWIGGRHVVDDGRLVLWSENKLRREAERQALRLLRRAQLA